MNIREATSDDNQKFQELQAKCPQGKTLIVSIVSPHFGIILKNIKGEIIKDDPVI